MSSNNNTPPGFGGNEADMQAQLVGLLTQFGINMLTGLGAILFFSILRKKNKVVYEPKTIVAKTLNKPAPPPIPKGFFTWIIPVVKHSEDELLPQLGLDSAIYLYFIKVCFKLFAFFTLIACAVLFPVHLMGTALQASNIKSLTLDNFSITNVDNSSMFWVHVGVMWLISIVIIFSLSRVSSMYVKMRHEYLLSEENQEKLNARALMLIDIPKDQQSEKGIVQIYNSFNIPYKFSGVAINRDPTAIKKLIDKREKTILAMEKYIVKHFGKEDASIPSERPKEIDDFVRKIQSLESEIMHERQQKAHTYKANSTGFITFPSVEIAQKVYRQLPKPRSGKTKALQAPPEKDILWDNVTMSERFRKHRHNVGLLIVFAICMTYSLFTTFIVSTANLSSLSNLIPPLGDFIKRYNWLAGIIQSYLPPILIAICTIVLIIVLRKISQFQGIFFSSWVEFSLMRKNYAFYMIQTFLVMNLSRVLISYLNIILSQNFGEFKNQNYTDFFKSLSQFLIQNSTIYINLIVFSGLTPIPLEIAQIVPLVIKFLSKRFLSATPRDLADVSGDFPFATQASLNLFLLSISLIYAVLQPLILIFMFLYFTIFYLVYKYQLLYVYSPQIDYRGYIWPSIQNLVALACIFAQLALIMVLFFREAFFQAIALAPLPFFTYIFRRMYLDRVIQKGEFLPEDSSEMSTFSTTQRLEGIRLQHSAFMGELMQPMVPEHTETLIPEFFSASNNSSQSRINRVLAMQEEVEE